MWDKRRRTFILAVLVAVASLAATALGLRGCSPSRGREKVLVGLTGTPDILDVPYFAALELGYFEDEGLEVEYRSLQGDATTIQAILSGSVDFGSAGLLSIMKAAGRGAAIRAFATVSGSHDYQLVAGAASGAVADLRGKTFGIFAPGDITETIAVAYLADHGVTRDEVTWVSLGGSSERLNALAARRIDATLLHSDDALRAAKRDGLHILGDVARQMPLPMSALAARTSDLRDRREIAAKMARALGRSSQFCASRPEEFVAIALRHLKGLRAGDILELHRALVKSGALGPGGLTPESLTNARRVLAAAGVELPGNEASYVDGLIYGRHDGDGSSPHP